jgi:hypothetical protein
MSDLQARGSNTAKNGFRNELFVIETFNNWKESQLAKDWLKEMNYNLLEIDEVKAVKVSGSFKSDVQVQINVCIKLKNIVDIQNISVKLVSNSQGFNQIDKRRVDKYIELWDIPADIANTLKLYCGEIKPEISNTRDRRRMFLDEFSNKERLDLINFLNNQKTLIVSDILKGRGKFAAEWMLVILNLEGQEIKWVIKPMNFVLNFFGNGEILVTNQGNIKIGRIGLQRKGGDGGRDSANMLQFKINPCQLFD